MLPLQDGDLNEDEEDPDFSQDDLDGVYFPNGSEESWRTLRHLLLAQSKCRIRALCLKTMAEADTIPMWATGLKKTPAIIPPNEKAVECMTALIRSQARARLQLAATLIEEECDTYGVRAVVHYSALEDIFNKENADFDAAANLLRRKTEKDADKALNKSNRIIQKALLRPVTDRVIAKHAIATRRSSTERKPVSTAPMVKRNAQQSNAYNRQLLETSRDTTSAHNGRIRPLMSVDIPPFVPPRFNKQIRNQEWQTNNKPQYVQQRRGYAQQKRPQKQAQLYPPATYHQQQISQGLMNPVPIYFNPSETAVEPNTYHQQQISQGLMKPVPIYCNPSETAVVMALRAQQNLNQNQHNNAPATATFAENTTHLCSLCYPRSCISSRRCHHPTDYTAQCWLRYLPTVYQFRVVQWENIVTPQVFLWR